MPGPQLYRQNLALREAAQLNISSGSYNDDEGVLDLCDDDDDDEDVLDLCDDDDDDYTEAIVLHKDDEQWTQNLTIDPEMHGFIVPDDEPIQIE